MALARVRGCAGLGSPVAEGPSWQADASRRRNGPRKATSRRPITVRLRGKSCPDGGHRVPPGMEKGSSGHGRPRTPQQADVGSKTRSAGRVPSCHSSRAVGGIEMDILFKSRHTTVPERFRRHAAAKLAKLERLDSRAVRVDVEVSKERNPRQADHSERVELTIRSRGPAVRAEAAADDRYAALDLAFAKLEGQLRRAAERRKARRDATVRAPGVLAGVGAATASRNGTAALAGSPEAMAPEE